MNERIKAMFQDKIDDAFIVSSLDARGYVDEYNLPELESTVYDVSR